jgi:soluble lytic murein transglycosylase-like protein
MVGIITFLVFLAPKVIAMADPGPISRPVSLASPPIVFAGTINPTDSQFGEALVQDLSRIYYEQLAGSRSIANAILENTSGLDPDFSFALAWRESAFDPNATNSNYDPEGNVISIDKGLFQLNSRTFPTLTNKQIFSLDINSREGLKHIRECLATTHGNLRKALYLYNAGTLVNVPNRTITYAEEILLKMEDIKTQRQLFVLSHSTPKVAEAVY